jgi:hypothetical protein
MKIGVGATDGKRYELLQEFPSVNDAVQQIKEANRIANAQNPIEIPCKNDYYIFSHCIVSVYPILY